MTRYLVPCRHVLSHERRRCAVEPTLASGGGQGQLTVVDLAAVHSRHLRVTQTSTAAQWWTVADLRVYG